MQVERQAALALKWSSAARLLSQTFTWVATIVVMRLLAPADYGLMAMSTVVISIMAGLAEFGLGAALIQAGSINKGELARIAGALALLNIACAAALILAAPLIADAFAAPDLTLVIRVSTLLLFLAAIEGVPQSLLKRDMNYKVDTAINVAAVLAASATTLILAWLEHGVWALVIGNLAGGALRTTLLLIFGTVVFPSFRLAGIGKHIRFGGQLAASRFLWQFTYQMDTLIAARFLRGEAVGAYAVAMHIATLPMIKVMGVVNEVAFSAIARLQDERARLHAALTGALRLLAFAGIPTMFGVSAVAPELVEAVLGEKWRGVVLPLQIAGIAAPARMLLLILATATDGVGRADLGLRNIMISVCILPPAFAIGVQWGLAGLATAWLIAIPIVLAVTLPATCATLGLTLREIGAAAKAPLIGGIAMYAIVAAVRLGTGQLDGLVRLPILVVSGAITYLVVVRILDRTVWSDAQRLIAAMRG